MSYPQIRTWLDTDAASYTTMPILVTSEGQARLELFKDNAHIDTVHIYRYSREELNELLVEMGQERDLERTWESIKAAQQFDSMLNNYNSYKNIAEKSDERARLEAEYDEEQRLKKEKEAAEQAQKSEEL